MNQRLSRNKTERLEKIAHSSRGLKVATRLPFSRSELIKLYFAHVAKDDLGDRDPKSLAAAALGHLSWALNRKPGVAKIRAFNPEQERDGWCSERTIVELVNDDMPFLVDSVTMALDRLGHGTHIAIHPLLRVHRTAAGRLQGLNSEKDGDRVFVESYIHMEIRRETDPEVLSSIEAELRHVLRNVAAAVKDWQLMVGKLHAGSLELRERAPTPARLLGESCEFLDWLADDNFTLLGYHEFRLRYGKHADRIVPIAGTGLGILRDPPQKGSWKLSGNSKARREIRSKTPLVITKSNSPSTIHRTGYLDQIDVKIFGRDGKPRTEKRFVGLFTSAAYSENPRDIPLIRLKIDQVMRKAGLDPRSHRGKALQHILDTFPRDELFQISVADLARISQEVRHLHGRRQVKLFCRRDVFGRFHSCSVYLPRDQYTIRTRRRVEALLMEAFEGTSAESHLTVSESSLAQLNFTIWTPASELTSSRHSKLETEIAAAVQTWGDLLRAALLERLDEDQALGLFRRFGERFPVSYQDEIAPGRASTDVQRVAAIVDGTSSLEMSLYQPPSPHEARVHISTCQLTDPIQLYTALPVLEHMSLRVISEFIYRIETEPEPVWIQNFEVEPASGVTLDTEVIEARLLECFRRVLAGDAESDGFNGFVVRAGLGWREITILRAYCKYLLQTSINYSQSYMLEVLGTHPELSRTLVEYFHSLFDPDLETSTRKARCSSCRKKIAQEMENVTNLDQDRILQAFLGVIEATVRTNFYQLDGDEGKPYISFKLNPARITELPEPRPQHEIFVYSPRVEGVHLRCGSIARGGLRWSDRREDFRTEILGLMKAQLVKNTVIVPTGAKGGFVCKQLPVGDRGKIQAEGIACYQTFIRGLLDLTDNIVGARIVPPDRVLRRDGDDPYLVVAADKGTATFSDLANEIAREYGFWLDDAYASGGSAGYDHKKMGITARGAWESVKRHFRELGLDTQSEPFTVVGVGDMAGDVFGNGMLLSRHIKLIAAFNHAHIFIDPDPDPGISYRERKRLFDLPRSSWADYDAKKLSAGGGIYSRQSKSIPLHPDVQDRFGLEKSTVTPPELIRALLVSKFDLLWNGGIGTYVKARTESPADVGDPANDAVRINGEDLRCRVVAEGGNLGLTQRGRIEYALSGGLINTDFIDNSAGVESSDREVNIKILLNLAISRKKLARSKRDALLASMTDEVTEQILQSNYAQTQALSIMDARSHERLGESARLIRVLESRGLLDRALEDLPTEEEIGDRRKLEKGLTRPELAVILSYSKIDLYASLVDTDIPEDKFLTRELVAYFPAKLRKRFSESIRDHRLSREIIAMRIAGDMINRMGPAFAVRSQEDTGATIAQITRAYTIAREVFEIEALWQEIEALDNRVQTQTQYALMFQITRMLRRAIYWLLQRHAEHLSVESMVSSLAPGARAVLKQIGKLESPRGQRRLASDIQDLVGLGISEGLAARVATLSLMIQTLDIVEVAEARGLEATDAARLYFDLTRGLQLDWLRKNIEELQVDGRWQAMARATLREKLAQAQRAVLNALLQKRGKRSPGDALIAWMSDSKADIARIHRTLEDMRTSGSMDFATLSVAIKEIERLV